MIVHRQRGFDARRSLSFSALILELRNVLVLTCIIDRGAAAIRMALIENAIFVTVDDAFGWFLQRGIVLLLSVSFCRTQNGV